MDEADKTEAELTGVTARRRPRRSLREIGDRRLLSLIHI